MKNEVREYLSEIGRRGGSKSRRVLTPAQAHAMRAMVPVEVENRRVPGLGTIVLIKRKDQYGVKIKLHKKMLSCCYYPTRQEAEHIFRGIK
jgi:hypothetical protein